MGTCPAVHSSGAQGTHSFPMVFSSWLLFAAPGRSQQGAGLQSACTEHDLAKAQAGDSLTAGLELRPPGSPHQNWVLLGFLCRPVSPQTPALGCVSPHTLRGRMCLPIDSLIWGPVPALTLGLLPLPCLCGAQTLGLS